MSDRYPVRVGALPISIRDRVDDSTPSRPATSPELALLAGPPQLAVEPAPAQRRHSRRGLAAPDPGSARYRVDGRHQGHADITPALGNRHRELTTAP
ncbi:MAG TPA: hypothetical protein VEM58_05315, partial [Streptosporangiaceae bacterium]|nr:hypothetical protein [Streptosporangiaceae bacterium]